VYWEFISGGTPEKVIDGEAGHAHKSIVAISFGTLAVYNILR
jgi:hypothetical protein